MHPVSPEFQERFQARLAQARAGSPEAFDDTTRPIRVIVHRLARQRMERRLQGKVSDSDILQITSWKAFKNLHEFQGSTFEEFAEWFLGIADHTISNQSRRYHRRKRDVGREISLEEVKDPLPIQQPTSEEEIERSSSCESVLPLLRLLPALYRKVIRWRSFKDRSFKEIGRRLGRSANAAKHLYYRALKKLRQKFRERGQE